MKNIVILGSTGSIGTQTLDIIRQHPNEFKIVGLTANKNIEILKKQIEEFKPLVASISDFKKANELANFTSTPIYNGTEGLIKVACLSESDILINSLVGSIGVEPTFEAIKSKKNVALANKETLVTAGSVIMNEAKQNNVTVMPIDSEHSAIFQCLNGENKEDVKKITITCSGGPFKNKSKQELEQVTVEDALKHPTWKMGSKITIDSSTLMNKGFEIIEAHWLYNTNYEDIEVVIHPQSIIHSLVEFKDNSVMAQLGYPDMKIPIQYALSYPKRLPNNTKQLNLSEIKTLDFWEPDHERFPCLQYAYDAGKTGGTLPAVLNAANEIAVQGFLDKKISYTDIPKLIKKMMDSHNLISNPSLKEILTIDKEVKQETQKLIDNN